MKIGYARVSTREQNLDMQLEALKSSGCTRIFTEKVSGTIAERPELKECLNYLREGDTLVVYKLDRLGRSLKNLIELLDGLKQKSISFVSLQDNLSTEGANGQLFTNILGAFAQFERDLIVERCQEGRKIAQSKGVKFGRIKDKVNKENEAKVKSCIQLYQAGSTISEIMQALRIGSRETIYRYLEKGGIVPRRKNPNRQK